MTTPEKATCNYVGRDAEFCGNVATYEIDFGGVKPAFACANPRHLRARVDFFLDGSAFNTVTLRLANKEMS